MIEVFRNFKYKMKNEYVTQEIILRFTSKPVKKKTTNQRSKIAHPVLGLETLQNA